MYYIRFRLFRYASMYCVFIYTRVSFPYVSISVSIVKYAMSYMFRVCNLFMAKGVEYIFNITIKQKTHLIVTK